ncbi:cytochrome c-type biogenesis CcmF C-terminal domain-containing protein, partial [Marinobacter sp.]|uniref:cytochrome c-type biogenesis CcmF C-terminal domain-containing protein n=1 Tax=Marinobacter sp. TaxID=50741 RepID=UPI0035C6DE90
KISVGPPYFEAVFLPLVLPALALMGCGTVARWKQGSGRELWQRLRVALVLTVVGVAVLGLAQAGSITPVTLLGVALGLWCLL